MTIMRPPQHGQGGKTVCAGSLTGTCCLLLMAAKTEQFARLRDVPLAAAIGQKPVMANRWKPWQDMQQEAADELVRGELMVLCPPALDAVILVVEGDAAFIGGDQAPVGDGDAMGVAGEIGEHRLRARKGNLSILPIIMDLGSRSATPTIRYTVRGAQSCGRRTQKGNAIFV